MANTELRDGEALDALIERGERWAKSYRPKKVAGDELDDTTRFERDFDARFAPDADELAEKCTLGARKFEVKDWIMAVLLWLIIAGGTLALSLLLMQPDRLWSWVFIGVAVLIFAVGLGTVYWDTTNESRAQKRLRDKTQWLLSSARRAVERDRG